MGPDQVIPPLPPGAKLVGAPLQAMPPLPPGAKLVTGTPQVVPPPPPGARLITSNSVAPSISQDEIARNNPWLAGDTTPVNSLTPNQYSTFASQVQDIERSDAHKRKIAELVQQIEQAGGVPKSVQWAAGHMSGGQTDSPYDQQFPGANAADIGLELAKGNIPVGPLARTLAGTLPFVPAREASQEAKDIAEATQIAMARQAETSNADRAIQAAGNMTGFLGNMYGPGLVANAAIKGTSALAKAGRMAAPMGLTMAAPALEAGEFKDAAVAGVKGAALGVALGGATRAAEALPGSLTPWIARPVAQTAVLTGNKILETGELPDKRDLAIDLALNAVTQGVPQRLVPESMRRSAPKVDEPLSSKLRPPSDATRAKYPQQATGARDPATGAILSPEKADAPVGDIESQMHPTTARSPSFHPKVDPITGAVLAPEKAGPPVGDVTSTLNPTTARSQKPPVAYDAATGSGMERIGTSPDPSYKAAVEGKKPVYLETSPSAHLQSAAEKAQSAEGFKAPGMETAQLQSGVAHYNPKVLTKWLSDPVNKGYRPLVAMSGGKIDFAKTLLNFEAADRLGAPLGYGLGNASKEGATHAVTGRAADGSEITTILAKNVAGAEKALKDQGAATIEVKPAQDGIIDITQERMQGGKPSTRESGFIDLSILTGKKKSQAERQAEQEIETVSEKRKLFQVQHADVAAQDDPLFIAGTKAMASQNAATRKAGVFAEDLWNSLGHDPKMVDLWTRYVVHQNAKAEQAKGKNVSPHLFMPHDEYLTVRENRELFNEAERVTREFSDAMSEHKDIVGIKGTRSVEDVPYFRLASIHTPELRQMTGARAARAKLPTGYLESAEFAEGTAEPSARGTGGIGPYNRGMARKSGSAKTATGQSDTYAVEPFTMAMEMLRSHELPARHNQFLNEVRSKAIPESDAKDAKFQTIYNGKKVKLIEVNVAKRPDWMPDEGVPELADEAAKATEVKKVKETLFVPEPVAKFWEDYTAPGAHDPPSKLNKLAQWPTKLSLATTVGDSTVQAMHGLSVASRIVGYGKGVWQKAVQRYGGIGRFLGAIQSVEDFNSPDAKRWHKLLTETGALRPQEMGPQSESNSWTEPEKWLETFAPPLHKLTTAVFDVGGVMDKQRVSWAQALKKTNPELTDAKIVHTVMNMGGAFVKAMQPKVVQGTPRVLAPFVQMGTTKARNALQQVVGRKPEAAVLGPGERKWSAEQLTRYPWAKATSIGAAWLLGNALSDDDETLEESLQHVGYAKIDGRLYPIAKFLDPTTEATSRLLGVNNAISSAALGESPTEITQNALRSPLNYVGGYVGPVPTAAMIATSDKLPFFGRNLYPIRAFPKSDDANPIAQRAKAVGSALLPGVEDQFTTSPDDATMSLRRQALERLLNLGGMKSRPYQEPKR